jgi:hypothetical protein
MTIEIVDFPIENGDFPYSYVAVYQRVTYLAIVNVVNGGPLCRLSPITARPPPTGHRLPCRIAQSLEVFTDDGVLGRKMEGFFAMENEGFKMIYPLVI